VGGQACATAQCHPWLGAATTATGFADASGKPRDWTGSLRPADLLAASTGAHHDLWLAGGRPQNPDAIGFLAFRPGCGACHTLGSDAHGQVPGCLDCHRFGGAQGPLHQAHVKAISAGQATNDPEGAKQGLLCEYCHAAESGITPLGRAACYNCHLSGHQPLDDQGQARFWPLPPGK
jgi:hypothetical protein